MGSASWFDISRQSKRRYRFPMPQNGETEDFPSWLSSMMRQSDQSPLGTDLWNDKLIIQSTLQCIDCLIKKPLNFRQQHSSFRLFLQFTDDDNNSTSESVLKVTFAFCWNGRRPLTRKKVSFFFSSAYCYRNHIAELKAPGGGTVCKRGWSGVAAELAELAFVNQVDDVTTDQLMTTPFQIL